MGGLGSGQIFRAVDCTFQSLYLEGELADLFDELVDSISFHAVFYEAQKKTTIRKLNVFLLKECYKQNVSP